MPKQTDRTAEQGAVAVHEMPADPRALYDEDFGSWAHNQIAAMQRRDGDALDWGNLIKEIHYLANEAPDKWEVNCARTMQHLLKIEHWDNYDEETPHTLDYWKKEITTKFRERMHRVVEKQPGVKGQIEDLWGKAWESGRDWAHRDLLMRHDDLLRSGLVPDLPSMQVRERKLDRLLPAECPWTLAEVVGYNPHSQDPDAEPDLEVWPPTVARRLNDELHQGADRYHFKGWVVDRQTGEVRERDEVNPDRQEADQGEGRRDPGDIEGRRISPSRVEPDRQGHDPERDLGPSR